MNKPLSLYLDSSTIGGYFDDAFKTATAQLWKRWEAHEYVFHASVLVDFEITRAPRRVRDLFAKTFSPGTLLPLTREADSLAQRYLAEKIVPAAFADDALHVAIAVTHAIPYIVSWNFKHLVNIRREAGFNAVNVLLGHPLVRIVSPLEL